MDVIILVIAAVIVIGLLSGRPRTARGPVSRSKRRNSPSNVAPERERGRSTTGPRSGTVLKGRAWVVDGDTIIVDKVSVRIFGIDAPEMDQPYGRKAKYAMTALCKGRTATATLADHTSYERAVATCRLPDGTDLAAELVRQGLALDWAKFSGGVYRHLEPAGVRKRLWRVDAKHRGRLRPVA